ERGAHQRTSPFLSRSVVRARRRTLARRSANGGRCRGRGPEHGAGRSRRRRSARDIGARCGALRRDGRRPLRPPPLLRSGVIVTDARSSAPNVGAKHDWDAFARRVLVASTVYGLMPSEPRVHATADLRTSGSRSDANVVVTVDGPMLDTSAFAA